MIDNLFLSVGAMKAATTWLYTVLSDHPEIYFTPEKEIHYFASEFGVAPDVLSDANRISRVPNYLRQIDSLSITEARKRLIWVSNYLKDPNSTNWYENLFINKGNQKYCADFSNLHCHIDSKNWHHVLNSAYNVKVLYTMRSPVKRLWSHAKFHAQFIGQADLIDSWNPKTLEEFVRKPHMWINSEYGRIIKKLKKSIPEESLKISFMEDIQKSPINWFRDLESFLEISEYSYNDNKINRRVNTSLKKDMPDWFPELFSKDIRRINKEIENLGYKVPDSWSQ